ncbi:MAG TPA: hypothetical protein VNS09_19515 [Solirubrobacter sp.]|nr:hypothetical protein [Solirubrobacter sp.]
MAFVGLVSDPRWEPPEGGWDPDGEHRRTWRVPWKTVVWVLIVIGLVVLVPIVGHAVGAFAGYLVLCVALAVGFWRFDRWCSRLYWRDVRDYQS